MCIELGRGRSGRGIKGEWIGVVAVLLLVLGLEALRWAGFRVPNPPALLLLAVAFATFRGGNAPGLTAAACAWLYFAYHFSVPGRPFRYTEENLTRVLIWAVTTPLMVLMVGALYARAVRLARAEETRRGEARLAAAEAKAAEMSERKVRQTLANALDAFIAMDASGRIIEWNPQAEAIFGYSRAEAVGCLLADTIIPPDFRGAHTHGLARFLATGEHRIMNRRIEMDAVRRDGAAFPVELSVSAVRDEAGWTFAAFVRDITERRAAEQRQSFMMKELDHRVKNNLAAVLAVADQTVGGSASIEEFSTAFRERILAMARLHNLLAQNRWEGADLRSVVQQTVDPYAPERDGRLVISGEPVTLPRQAVSSVCMALHELATNAAKYGALSVPGGRVEVRWSLVAEQDGSARVRLVWSENGGPPTTEPANAGFGLELIRRGVPYEIAGESTLEFTARGVRCELVVPLGVGGEGALDESRA